MRPVAPQHDVLADDVGVGGEGHALADEATAP